MKLGLPTLQILPGVPRNRLSTPVSRVMLRCRLCQTTLYVMFDGKGAVLSHSAAAKHKTSISLQRMPSSPLQCIQKMVSVNKIIACGYLEQFDVVWYIRSYNGFLTFTSPPKILRTPHDHRGVNLSMTASLHWFVIYFVPLSFANAIWSSYHGPTKNHQKCSPHRNFAPNSFLFSRVAAPVG